MKRSVSILYHAFGFASVLGAISVELLMFYYISTHGYFMAVEDNLAVRTVEILLAIYALAYFLVTTYSGRKLWKRGDS